MRTDSCATANHPMIDHIWRERLMLCDRLIGVRPQAPFSSARRLEMLRNAAIGAAKAARSSSTADGGQHFCGAWSFKRKTGFHVFRTVLLSCRPPDGDPQ